MLILATYGRSPISFLKGLIFSYWSIIFLSTFGPPHLMQVELSCSSGAIDISYVVSLYPLSMATAVIVKNNGRKPVNLTSAILTHFKSKKRNGTGVQGLRSCSYCTFPPPSSQFEILSPSEAMKTEDPGFFSFGREPEKKPGEWTTQDVPFTVLEHKLSRVYGAPPAERSKEFYNTIPSNYEILDQVSSILIIIIALRIFHGECYF